MSDLATNAAAAAAPQQPDHNMNQQGPQGQPVSGVEDSDDNTAPVRTHDALPPQQYGENTPTKRMVTSGAWKEVKRLRGDHNNDKKDGTHICLVKLAADPNDPNAPPQFCNAILKLHKTKPCPGTGVQTWLTTRAVDHLKTCHPVDSEVGKKFAEKQKAIADDLVEQQMAYGMPASDGKTQVGGTFNLSKQERSLSAQAQWYVYSSMQISKDEFESTWFKKMLQEVGDGERTAILTQNKLRQFVRAEFEIFIIFLKLITKMKYAIARGNAYAQGLHDGGTLISKRKYQALALQFVAPEWKRNLVVTIGLKRSLHNKDTNVAEIWTDLVKERTGFDVDEIIARMRSDRAAKGVAEELGLEEVEVCEMHDTDKLGRAATGALVRTKNKTAINPFQEGVDLVSRAHKMGTYFGYSNRQNELEQVCKELGDVATVRIQVDFNSTRIAAVHGLLYSEIRLNRGLKAYELKHKPGWAFKGEDWVYARDFEGVLNATRLTSTLAQVEKDYMGAYTCLIKSMALTKLRAPTMQLIDIDAVTKETKLPRVDMPIANMSKIGQTARTRATLEGERRWCGNTGETLTGAPVGMGRAELLCALLDKRTLGCHHITTEQRKEALKIYEEEYVKFSLTAAKYTKRLADEKRNEMEETTVKIEREQGGGSSASQLASGAIFQGTMWSEDEDDDEADGVEVVAAEAAALEEARRVLKNWKKYTVDWVSLFAHLKDMKKDNQSLDLTEDLMKLDIGKVYGQIEAMDTARVQFGWIPTMASSSVGQIGALSAESYCERILSCANNVITKGNTLLGDEELEMIVVLRMNREFMQFMRTHYSAIAKQAFGQTVVRGD